MMMRRGGIRLTNTMLVTAGTRFFSSTASSTTTRAVAKETLLGASAKGLGGQIGNPVWASRSYWIRSYPSIHGSVRNMSHVSVADEEQGKPVKSASATDSAVVSNKNEKGIVSYWGVPPSRITKEDGTEWKWNCFRPWETYKADLSIDLKKHHAPVTFMDKLAYWTVKSLRVPTDIFFQRRYGCRAMMLETVAAVPGMVGGMLLHCKSLRRFEHSGGWIKILLEEAENERMHLMTFMEVAKPKWYERALVFTVQGVFFNAYFLGYLLSPKFAHRMVGYLEEEAIHSYTEFLKELDKGNIENVPAPAIAIDYWQLPPDSTLRDVVMVVRADEAHHRDVNHFASDMHYQGRELREAPAPFGYH
ncbi:Ubiquinol oxidase [Quillaja saponaria]|uniref:Ubiquinol oxidase n=1 Tax=Quillaja saponaria TaxID=32244 RepID=A0AAD7KQP9_QUISA|nr:Ubiquinol oxidase [Quillaja saponaria]